MADNYITETDILDEAKDNFLTYASEVLTDRAIPSVEDGLLSVQRKILWTMEEVLNMDSKSKTKKCNALVGSTLASSYFHGDRSCYGALCKMSQPYLMRYPLIQGQGSLGTQENNDMRASSRYCVAGDTYISTEEGMKQIKDIVPNSTEDSECEIDLTVQGGFGKKRKAVKFFNTGIRDIYKIQLQNGMWIKVTPNHPLLTLDTNLNFCWKLAEDLKEDDKLLVPYTTDNACFGNNNDLLEAKMLGCMISKGYATTQNRVGINNKDLDMITPVFNFINANVADNSASICCNEKRDYHEYCIANKDFYNLFVSKYEFEKADKKHFPKRFFEGTKEYQAICLAYLFEGDGSVDIEHGISYSSISEELIHQLQIVLIQNFGIMSNIIRSNTRNEIKLLINNVSAPTFLKEIGFISKRKQSKLQELVDIFTKRKNIANGNICAIHEVTNYVRRHHIPGTATKVRNVSFNNIKTISNAKNFVSEEEYIKIKNIIDNYYYIKITSIEKVTPEVAYSIKIDDDTHSFIGNGFVNHNTEAKPRIYRDLMFNNFRKDVVPLVETYNNEYYEPVVLPALFPNALVNGREAIGISMRHNSQPMNLREVCRGIVAYIKNPQITLDEMIKIIPGPDYPLGGTVINSKEIYPAFATGKSNYGLRVRGDYIIEGKNIIFTTIPYRTYRNKIKEQIEKNIDVFDEFLSDFNDESNVGQNRLVFTVKDVSKIKYALNKIFALTDLEKSISYNMNFIVNGTPKLCSLLDLISNYYKHQSDVLIKAKEFDKKKAESRLHIIVGLLKALNLIDQVIATIKQSQNKADARTKLIALLEIDEEQANAILDMKLSRLSHMEKHDLEQEKQEKENIIIECDKIINDKRHRDEVLITMVEELSKKYGDDRRTKLENIEPEPKEKEIVNVEPEKCVVIINENDLVKRIPVKNFKVQNRNGIGIKNKDDIIKCSIRTNTIDSLMIFTNKGTMYRILVDDIPVGTNTSKGVPISSLLEMETGEKRTYIYSIYRDTTAEYVLFTTKQGMVKKTPLKEYVRTKRKSGLKAINLKEGDIITSVNLIDNENIILITKQGQCICIPSTSISSSGRTTMGVKGITLKEGDEVISTEVIRHNTDTLAIFAVNGMGKRCSLSDIPCQGRGGKGVIIYKECPIASTALVEDTDNVFISGTNSSICISAQDIPIMGRVASGNQLIKNSQITSVTKI